MFETLPLELIVKIVKYLPIYDRIRLRNINKKWRIRIDTFFKIENLVIQKHKSYTDDFDDLDELADCYSIKHVSKLQFTLNQEIFTKLRRLKCSKVLNSESICCLKKLSAIKSLISLEISELRINEDSQRIILDLPRLQYFSIKSIRRDGIPQQCVLQVNASQLTVLKLDHSEHALKEIEFAHPESIKSLYIFQFSEQIYKFANLLHLDFVTARNVDPLGILSNFKNLEQLHLKDNRPLIIDLMLEKMRLNRFKLRLFFKYIELESANDLRKFDCLSFDFYFLNKKLISLFDENLDELAEKFAYRHIGYDCLDDFYGKREMPDKIISKFKNLNLILINQITNLNNLTRFLSACKKIKKMEINFLPLLSQSFFDDLPNLCAKLEHLKILKMKSLDLEFLFKFKNLLQFWLLDRPLTIDFIKTLFEKTEINELICEIEGYKSITKFESLDDLNERIKNKALY